jgi:hypothetical protein
VDACRRVRSVVSCRCDDDFAHRGTLSFSLAARAPNSHHSHLTIHKTKTHSSITPAYMGSTVSPYLMSRVTIVCNDAPLVSTAWPLSGTKHGLLVESGGWGQPHSPMFSPAQGLPTKLGSYLSYQ